MDEKKRKSSRSFELEKGGKHSFDLNKTSARKFDLAKDSDEVSLEELKKELLADGKIDAEEVNKLREVLYADGKIDQEEADFLFALNDAVSGKPNDSGWKAFFVEAITDYLLNDEQSPGVIDETEGKWLEEKINNDDNLDSVERALVASLRRKSKSMPQSLNNILSQVASRFKLEKDEVPAAEAAIAATALAEAKAQACLIRSDQNGNGKDLEQLKNDILADGKIDKEEVKLLHNALYADGKIDQEEADFIFELNDAVSGKKNDPTWNQLFVQVVSDYLLKDEKSPGIIDEEEGKWLAEKIGSDGKVDDIEKQLLNHLKKNAKKMPAIVTALIASALAANSITPGKTNLQQLKKEILADGKIDKEEVKQLRNVLYTDGKIDQEEADFLFEINDAVSGKKNDPTWNQFFVQAISDYLLNDEKSPGVIDGEEGKWLVEKIGADGKVDGVEKQLLNHLKQNAKKIPSSLIALLNGGIGPNTSKKNTEPQKDPVVTPTKEKTTNQSKSSKGKMIAAALAGLLVLGGGYYLLQEDNSDSQLEEGITAQNESQFKQGTAAMTMDSIVQGGGDGVETVESESVKDEDAKPNPAIPEEDVNVEPPANNDNGDGERLNPITPSTAGEVNLEKNTTQSSSMPTGTVEQEALNVIRGEYGNGNVRKQRLGSRYDEIQSKVNEMYRTGKVY